MIFPSEQALAQAAPIDSKPGRYRPPDALLAFLEGHLTPLARGQG